MPEDDQNGEISGVLLVNLGTPEAPERKPVARFLRECRLAFNSSIELYNPMRF